MKHLYSKHKTTMSFFPYSSQELLILQWKVTFMLSRMGDTLLTKLSTDVWRVLGERQVLNT